MTTAEAGSLPLWPLLRSGEAARESEMGRLTTDSRDGTTLWKDRLDSEMIVSMKKCLFGNFFGNT